MGGSRSVNLNPLLSQVRTHSIMRLCALRRRAIAAKCRKQKSSASVDLAAQTSRQKSPVTLGLPPKVTWRTDKSKLSGAVLTEQVFTVPGFGKLIVDAVFNRDYAVVQGVVLVTATAYILLNLMADIAYFLINPRLRA